MSILNNVTVPKKFSRDPLSFLNIHSVANFQKKGGTFEVIKNFQKVSKCQKTSKLKTSGSLASFRGSGRRFCFGRYSDNSIMCLTSVLQVEQTNKVNLTRIKQDGNV